MNIAVSSIVPHVLCRDVHGVAMTCLLIVSECMCLSQVSDGSCAPGWVVMLCVPSSSELRLTYLVIAPATNVATYEANPKVVGTRA